jgi:hypothetical protein
MNRPADITDQQWQDYLRALLETDPDDEELRDYLREHPDLAADVGVSPRSRTISVMTSGRSTFCKRRARSAPRASERGATMAPRQPTTAKHCRLSLRRGVGAPIRRAARRRPAFRRPMEQVADLGRIALADRRDNQCFRPRPRPLARGRPSRQAQARARHRFRQDRRRRRARLARADPDAAPGPPVARLVRRQPIMAATRLASFRSAADLADFRCR